MLTVVIKRAGEPPEVARIEDSLKAFQTIVGGYVEAVYQPDGTIVWCNSEGLLIGLPLNVRVGPHALHGDIVVASYNEEGENVSLTDAQVARWMECLR